MLLKLLASPPGSADSTLFSWLGRKQKVMKYCAYTNMRVREDDLGGVRKFRSQKGLPGRTLTQRQCPSRSLERTENGDCSPYLRVIFRPTKAEALDHPIPLCVLSPLHSFRTERTLVKVCCSSITAHHRIVCMYIYIGRSHMGAARIFEYSI